MTYPDAASGRSAGWAFPRPAAAPVSPDPVVLRFGDVFKVTLLHIDLALITLWFIVTAAQFKYDELLLYPLALYFTASFFVWREATWPVAQRGGLLVLLPLWWMTSTLWAPDAVAAFRTGVQSLLTILICMFIASRLNTRQFVAAILFALTVIALRSLPDTVQSMLAGLPAEGVFSHKNRLGVMMVVLFAVSLMALLDQRAHRFVRLLALGTAPLSLGLVFASQSATAILMVVAISGIVFGALALLGTRNRISLGSLGLIATMLTMFALAAVLMVNLLQENLIDLILAALGKERTLTGRTDLWAIGLEQIELNPFLGTGARGYWRYHDNFEVRQIFVDYHLTHRSSFTFHNSWLEISVNLGLIGLCIAVAAVTWAFTILISRAFRIGGAIYWTGLAISMAIFVRTFAESDLFTAFNMLHMLLWTLVLIRPDAEDL